MTTVTLTVVRHTDQTTYPFVSSISGATAITVRKGSSDNYTYHYYAPTTDTLGDAITGTTETDWKVVQTYDYLQSDGSSYINTGFYHDNNTRVTAQLNYQSQSNKWLFCGRSGSSDNQFGYFVEINSINTHFRYGNTDYTIGSNIFGDVTVDFNKNVYTLNSYSHTFTASTFTSTLPMLIFAMQNAISNFAIAKLYSFDIYDNGSLVRDYIPISYNDGTNTIYALYDNCLSNDVIYGNEGSGTFSGGGTQSALTYTHTVTTPEITAVTASPSTAPTVSTITVTATLENAPSTDAGTVTFYTSRTPTVSSSWVSQGSKNISEQSASGIVTHTFTASSTAGTYYVKAVLSDTTQSVTYDSYTDGGITNITYTLTQPTISSFARTTPESVPIESTVGLSVTLLNVPTTDAGTVTFYTSPDATTWTSVGSKAISSQSSAGIIEHTFTGSSTVGTYYLKAVLSDTTRSVTYDTYTDGHLTRIAYTTFLAPEITALTIDDDALTAGDVVTATATLLHAPSTDRGEVIFWVTQSPTNGDSWRMVGRKELAQETASSTITVTWNCTLPATTWYVKAILRDATKGTNYDSYTNGGLTNVTYSVSFDLTPDVSQLPPAEFRLCDENNRMSIVISQYESFKYTEVWGDADTFTLVMKRTANHADELMSGRLLMVASDQTHDYYRVMVILQISVDEETITATGRDYLWDLLRGRVAVWANGVTLYRTSEVQTGNAETVARYFINQNCLQSPNVYRRDSFVVFEDERTSPLGGDVSVVAHMQGLDEIMASVCTQGNVDLYGALVEDTSLARGYYIKAMFRVGTDHSQDNEDDNPWVVLSEEYGNARMTEFISNVPESNVAEVSAYGQYSSGSTGIDRYFNTIAGETTTSGIRRREVFFEIGWCGTYSEPYGEPAVSNAKAAAQEKLDNMFSESIEFELVNLNMYGRDFIIGDIITCDAGAYGSYNLQLTEVTTTYTPEKTTVSVKLGAEIQGVMSVIREAQRPTPIYDNDSS